MAVSLRRGLGLLAAIDKNAASWYSVVAVPDAELIRLAGTPISRVSARARSLRFVPLNQPGKNAQSIIGLIGCRKDRCYVRFQHDHHAVRGITRRKLVRMAAAEIVLLEDFVRVDRDCRFSLPVGCLFHSLCVRGQWRVSR